MSLRLCNFTTLNDTQQAMILKWRNHEKVRAFMYHAELISENEHRCFIETLKSSLEQHYFLVKKDGLDIGVIDFNHISSNSPTIGLYVNPYLQEKGLGTLLMSGILTYASTVLNVTVLRAEVFALNLQAIRLYQKFNFYPVNEKDINHQKVICMERRDENR